MRSYFNKYMKYKKKYLDLKSNIMKGGEYKKNLTDMIAYKYSEFINNNKDIFYPQVKQCSFVNNVFECKTLIPKQNENINDFININDLHIENSADYIEYMFNNYGIIILRQYKGENILILGCGNYRLDDGGGYSFLISAQNKQKYYNQHNHRIAYTIDADIGANPSIIGNFGTHKFVNIPNNSFKLIVNEGGNPEGPEKINELIRLLQEDGFFIDIKDNIYYFLKKSNGMLIMSSREEFSRSYIKDLLQAFTEDHFVVQALTNDINK